MSIRRSPNPGAKCGHPKSGRSDAGDGPCGNSAGRNTDHLGWGWCDLHGGNSPSGKKYAARLEAEDMRRRFMADPEPVSPEEALEQVLAASFAMFKELRRQLADAGSLDAASARTLDLFAAERERLERAAKAAGGLNLAERQVRIAEQQGELMVHVVRAALGSPDLGLIPAQRVRVEAAFRRELALALEPKAALPPGGPFPDDEIEEAEVVM